MKRLSCFLLALTLSATALAASRFSAETGVSYFSLRSARYEPNPTPFMVQGGRAQFAPFVAAGYSFTERFGLRLSYHFLDDVRATAEFGAPSGGGPDHAASRRVGDTIATTCILSVSRLSCAGRWESGSRSPSRQV